MTGVGAGGERLDSWKAIAAYLGKDAGTVRRWERTRGLPVHRVPGGKGTSVYAFTTEIDAWLRAPGQETVEDEAAEPSPFNRRWLSVATVSALAAISIGLASWFNRGSAIDPRNVKVHLTEQSLTAIDGEGRELWVHQLADGWRHFKTIVSDTTKVTQGRDPRVYFVTSHRMKGTDGPVEGGEFTALGIDGTRDFTFRFFDNVRFGGKPYGEPWAVTAFSAPEDGQGSLLAVAAHHWLWSPSLLAILDRNGKRLGTYANYGWIEQLTWLSADRLLFGGFSHSHDGGMVGLLDPRQLDGQSPEDPSSPFYCDTCGTNLPLKLVVMPRTEVNVMTQSRFNRAIVERTGDRVIVRTIEVPAAEGQGAADAIYEFTTALEFISASFSQYYWQIHERLYGEKKIDHDRDHCPFKNGPQNIRLWTRESGWSVIPTN